MLKAGLPIEKWVSRMFWYCADGAEVMRSTGNGVAGLLMQLQAEGYSVVVPMHANCQRADLAGIHGTPWIPATCSSTSSPRA